MKRLLFLLAFVPAVATAQFDNLDQMNNRFQPPAAPAVPVYPPVYGIPVQPILPVPRDNGPWGTGYSVVTTTRQDRPNALLGQDFGRDITDSETVTKVVPNDATGNPIRGVDIW